jgi:putative glutamine amidotransferase
MKERSSLLYPLYLACLLIIHACSYTSRDPVFRIAVSKMPADSNYYLPWMGSTGHSLEAVNLYPLGVDSAVSLLGTCDALLLTGGPDIHPANYGRPEDSARCEDINVYRDSLELALIREAGRTGMPVFGICRGLQVLNVALGGSLIIDIPSDFSGEVTHRIGEGFLARHEVAPVAGSLLYGIAAGRAGTVVSAHHQGIDRLSDQLNIVAYAPDSLPEAIEWELNGQGGKFLMAVQWHPERMDYSEALSGGLAREFIRNAKCYHETKDKKTGRK